MYIKDIKDRDTLDVLILCSCMNCQLIPKFKSDMMSDGVSVTVSFKDNPNWTFIVDEVEGKKNITHSYCPVCSRKIKLSRLKEKI